MKNQSITFLITGFAIFLLLSACDPGVSHKKIIENHSDYDLAMVIYIDSNVLSHAHDYARDSFLISKKNDMIIYEENGLGQTTEYDDCSTFVDSIRVYVIGNDSLHLALDLNDQTKWTYTRLSKSFKKGGKCECRIRITNEDIQY
jgi:hypothetical protein